jgi:hypothetical protein
MIKLTAQRETAAYVGMHPGAARWASDSQLFLAKLPQRGSVLGVVKVFDSL